MKDLTPLQVVEDINYLLYKKQGENEILYALAFISDGNISYIKFQDEVLWDSDNDERAYIEESDNLEPLFPFIKKRLNQYINRISKCKVR